MTLTEVNYYVRKFFPVALIMLLVMVIMYFAFQLLSLYFKERLPPKPAPIVAVPTVIKFNQIQPPVIPHAKPADAYNYALDTLDGTTVIEHATSAAAVHFIPKETPTFGFLSQVYLMAKAVGFNTDTIEHTKVDNIVRFDDGKRKLEIDINNYNFSFDYIINKGDEVQLESVDQPNEDRIKAEAANFLSVIGRYPRELAQGKQNLIYLNFNLDTKQITTLDRPMGANMVELDFYRPDINGYPVVTSTYYNSPHYVLFAFNQGDNTVIRAQMKFFEYSTQSEHIGIYPLKTSQEAWEQLKNGKGYVVSSNKESGDVKIKKIVLAYYDPDVYQQYFQPVYVFLGDDRFAAYVPAVKDEYLLSSQ